MKMGTFSLFSTHYWKVQQTDSQSSLPSQPLGPRTPRLLSVSTSCMQSTLPVLLGSSPEKHFVTAAEGQQPRPASWYATCAAAPGRTFRMAPVLKRVNTAGLTADSWNGLLTRLILGCHLGTWIWGGFPLFPELDKGGSLHLKCTNNVVSAEHLLTIWESGVWGRARQGHPVKTLGAESLMRFYGWEHVICIVTPLGKNSWKTEPGLDPGYLFPC